MIYCLVGWGVMCFMWVSTLRKDLVSPCSKYVLVVGDKGDLNHLKIKTVAARYLPSVGIYPSPQRRPTDY
jgi:hypothetical protein